LRNRDRQWDISKIPPDNFRARRCSETTIIVVEGGTLRYHVVNIE
jgi:hypothetical protein